MPIRYDLAPAAAQLARVAAGVNDGQLDAATPCVDWSVAGLLAHVLGFTAASTAAASRTAFPADSPELNGNLLPDWRDRLPGRLDALVLAWRVPEAWDGWAEAGGIRTPADVAGTVALHELVLHGWDLARAIGQAFEAGTASVQVCLDFVTSLSEPGQETNRSRLYGPVVPVSEDATAFDQLLAAAGRNPQWVAEPTEREQP